MNLFRLFLAACLLTIAGYTAVTIGRQGLGLLPIFFGDMAGMSWRGQFNLDFSCFLLLSGLWIAWRHRFSPAGIALGLLGVFGGMLFLSAYLLIAIRSADGDIETVLVGGARSRS